MFRCPKPGDTGHGADWTRHYPQRSRGFCISPHAHPGTSENTRLESANTRKKGEEGRFSQTVQRDTCLQGILVNEHQTRFHPQGAVMTEDAHGQVLSTDSEQTRG